MRHILMIVAGLVAVAAWSGEASAFNGKGYVIPNRPAQMQPWHGGYSNTQWGRPVALVVPPTARFETSWGWGVGHSEMRPLEHQFGRHDPGAGGGSFRSTPYWPSHTQQFGTYYIRGPW